jgi:HAD superfamily hydrolase (TIGR01459 family)
MAESTNPVPLIEHFAEIRSRYDAIICDVWGVLHNGLAVTPAANATLIAARESGMAVAMLTNAPRMPAEIEKFIAHLGGDNRGWDALVSSGGVTRHIMEKHGDRPFHHVGPPRDVGVFLGLEARPVPFDEADYLLCTGLIDDERETAETYRPMLEAMLGRGTELICANPDIVVERGHRLVPCAGAIADLYERMGGPVTWIGKPHPLVYAFALGRIEEKLGRPVDKSRILAIGDALRTDVAGANAFGVDSLFVLDGIHSAELGLKTAGLSADALQSFFARAAQRPTYATLALRE